MFHVLGGDADAPQLDSDWNPVQTRKGKRAGASRQQSAPHRAHGGTPVPRQTVTPTEPVIDNWEQLSITDGGTDGATTDDTNDWSVTSYRNSHKNSHFLKKRSTPVPPIDNNSDADDDGTGLNTDDDATAQSMAPITIVPGQSIPLRSSWRLWAHEKETKDWFIESYFKLGVVSTVETFWNMFNNFEAINGLGARYYYLMRGDILPTWEDSRMRYGTIWSIQIPTEYAVQAWERLSALIIGETLITTSDAQYINGISTVKHDGYNRYENRNDSFYLTKIMTSRQLPTVNMVRIIHRALADIIPSKSLSIRAMQPRPEY